MKRAIATLCLLLSLCFGLTWSPAAATADEESFVSPSPAGAYVYLIEPADGQEVDASFPVKFGLSGMGVAPAGVDKQNTGHHHLLIDLPELPDLTQAMAASANLKHFGGGQTEAVLALPPGEHTLQLVLGNYAHIPHNPPVVSDKVTVTVR